MYTGVHTGEFPVCIQVYIHYTCSAVPLICMASMIQIDITQECNVYIQITKESKRKPREGSENRNVRVGTKSTKTKKVRNNKVNRNNFQI